MTTTTTSIRVFTHRNVPSSRAVAAQTSGLAAAYGLEVEFVAAETDAGAVIAAGVLGLPAIVAYSGSTEIARRECASAGRWTRRWFERKVAPSAAAPASVPAMA